jgi:hypothetical protein
MESATEIGAIFKGITGMGSKPAKATDDDDFDAA